MPELACRQCGRRFTAKPSLHAIYCSRACYTLSNVGKRPPAFVTHQAQRTAAAAKFTCLQCGDLFKAKPCLRKIYCGNECYHKSKVGKASPWLAAGRARQSQAAQARRQKICVECNNEFSVCKGWWHSLKMYCSKDCQFTAGRRAIRKLVAEGTPLIQISETQVVCRICNRHLRCAGTHFVRVHGLETGATHSSRNIAYGIAQGERLEAHELLVLQRKRGVEEATITNIPTHLRASPGLGLAGAANRARPSVPQRVTFPSLIPLGLHGSQVRKARARRTGRCLQCNSEVVYVASAKRGRVFCSNPCASTWIGVHQNMFITPESRARTAEKTRALRATRKWSSRTGPRWHRTIVCPQCGQQKTIPRSKMHIYCSTQCYHKSRSTDARTALSP